MGVRRFRWVLVVASFGATLAANVAARASDRAHARLAYSPDVARCPSDRELRDAVAARLGYDPFEGPSGPRSVDVSVSIQQGPAGRIDGSLSIRGVREGHRELSSPRGDCREVVDALAVAIAIGLDPSTLTRSEGGLPPLPPPARAEPAWQAPLPPPPSHVERPRPPPVERAATSVRLGAGPTVLFGELPAVAPGLAVAASLRWRAFESVIEGLATLPVTHSFRPGRITASLLTASFLPCGHVDWFFACGGVSVGSLAGEGNAIAFPLHGSRFYSSFSARIGAEHALGSSVWVRGYAEAVTPLSRVTLQLGGEDVWRMPSVGARLGVAAGIRF